MPPSKELIHAYANTRITYKPKWNDIFDFYNVHGPASWHMNKQDRFLCTRTPTLSKYKVFSCENDAKAYIQMPSCVDADFVTWPEREEYKAVQHEFFVHIGYIRDILDRVITGCPPSIELNMIFKRAVELDLIGLETISETWLYSLGTTANWQNKTVAVEDYVEINGLLLPTVTDSQTKLKQTKKCAMCHKYYQAKGAKAIYCTETCRSKSRFKLKM